MVMNWGLGTPFYEDSQVRKLSEATESALLIVRLSDMGPSVLQRANRFDAQGAQAILDLLAALARESGHGELIDAPLLFWGHSAAGTFGPTFAVLHAQRTIAFVRYHTGSSLSPRDVKVLTTIPALEIIGSKDEPAMQEGGETFWQTGRMAGALWTYAIEPDAEHMSLESLSKANALVIPWITAVLRHRTSPDGGPLRALAERDGWVGNNQTGEAALYGAFRGSKPEASWLPDEASAQGWKVVLGRPK